MKEITRPEAETLLAEQNAGWYAIHANPPIAHSSQHVVEIGDRFFLCELSDFTVVDAGKMRGVGLTGRAHKVMCFNSELSGLIKAEINRVAPGASLNF